MFRWRVSMAFAYVSSGAYRHFKNLKANSKESLIKNRQSPERKKTCKGMSTVFGSWSSNTIRCGKVRSLDEVAKQD